MKEHVIPHCMDQAQATLRAVNDMLYAWVDKLGGWNHLPEKFTLKSAAIIELQDRIEAAVGVGDLQTTQDLCDEYKRRFADFLAKWDAKIAQDQAKAA